MQIGDTIKMVGKTNEGGRGRFSIPDAQFQHARKVAQKALNPAASTRKLSNASRGHELRNQVPD